jgi:hypothetical protein
VNWDEVARHLYERAERDLSDSTDDAGVALLAELRDYGVPPTVPQMGGLRSADLLLPIHIRKDGVELRMCGTIMTLGTPRDITLQELRLETFFPADRASEETWPKIRSTDRVQHEAYFVSRAWGFGLGTGWRPTDTTRRRNYLAGSEDGGTMPFKRM